LLKRETTPVALERFASDAERLIIVALSERQGILAGKQVRRGRWERMT
jgi:hypothetical protein